MIDYSVAAGELRSNPGQWQAYESKGNCVILAGPGSGKTKTLTIKISRVLAEDIIYPSGIACLTYGTECVRELQKRLACLGVRESHNVFIGTLHSFVLRHVVVPFARLSGMDFPIEFSIASMTDQNRIFKASVGAILGHVNSDHYKTRFELYRRTYIDRDSKDFAETDSEIAALVSEYEQRLNVESLIDFDGMILIALHLIERFSWVRKALKARFPVLVVDEYQDLGLPLHRIVLALCQKAGVRLIAVGDPDQSIFGFAGSMPKLLEELAASNWVEAVKLRFNYRCGRRIVGASLLSLGEVRDYESKAQEVGTIDFYECREGIAQQASIIVEQIIPDILSRDRSAVLGDIAVLYGNKSIGSVVASAVREADLQFIRIDGGAPYRRTALTKWLEDCAKWCAGGWSVGEPSLTSIIERWFAFNRTMAADADRSLQRRQLVVFLFNHRGPSQLLRDWFWAFAQSCIAAIVKIEPWLKDEVETLRALYKATLEGGALRDLSVAGFAGQGGSSDHLNLITLHSAKGLEFRAVIMMGMDQGIIPRWNDTSVEALAESRRLFYVGLTRAKSQIHMTYSGFTVNQYGRRFAHGPSVFLNEIQARSAT